MAAHRPSVLLVLDDSDLLDTLTTLLEARGFEVAIAATAFAATGRLDARKDRDFDAVVAGWDAQGLLGARLYRWALGKRFHLRDRFIFLAEERADSFDEQVEGRCLLLHPRALEEIVRAVDAASARARRVAEARIGLDELEWIDADSPTLLLVDDEPLQLTFMARLFRDLGFSVTPAESGNAAVALLSDLAYDVILSDWYMPDGSGADLYRWVMANRPELGQRCLFITGAVVRDLGEVAPGARLFPKGQDSRALVHAIVDIARASRH
jgi:CheY-like chemotaxis protein